jgi:formate-nitrite transporter family protein
VEPVEIFASSLRLGVRRLERPWLDLAATGLLGSLSIVLASVLAATAAGLLRASGVPPGISHLGGALLFPLGFMVLLQVRAELFTENFLVPVNAVLDRLAPARLLLRLWAGTLVTNVLGAVAATWLFALPNVFPESVRAVFTEIADERMYRQSAGSLAASSVIAGFVITLMTLAMLRETVGGWVAVFAAGFLLYAADLHHVVVDTVDIWLGIWAGSHIAIPDWLLRNLLPVLVMNVIGGIGLATLPHYLQIYQRRDEVLQDVKEDLGAAPHRRRV